MSGMRAASAVHVINLKNNRIAFLCMWGSQVCASGPSFLRTRTVHQCDKVFFVVFIFSLNVCLLKAIRK